MLLPTYVWFSDDRISDIYVLYFKLQLKVNQAFNQHHDPLLKQVSEIETM